MKVSNKSNLAAGVVLLLLAAFFSIALILQPLDFGQFGPGHENILYKLGAMISSVYGYTSILIPVFLLVAALSCFASKWTARKSMRLLTAIVPFFTCFGAEKLCKFFATTENFRGLKISVTLIVTAMLVVIEFLLAGIAADKINGTPVPPKAKSAGKGEGKRKAHDEDSDEDSNDETDDSDDYEDDSDSNYDEYSDNYSEEETYVESMYDSSSSNDDSDENTAETIDINVYEGEILPSEKIATEEVQAEMEKNGTSDDPFADVFEKPLNAENFSKISSEAINAGNHEEAESDVAGEAEKADEDEPSAPGSIITQEEYAALTGFNEEEEEEADELEWPDAEEIRAKAGNTAGDLSDFEETSEEENPDEENPDEDLDSGIKKCGTQEMSVFGNETEDSGEENLNDDFENSFSVYEGLVKDDELIEEEYDDGISLYEGEITEEADEETEDDENTLVAATEEAAEQDSEEESVEEDAVAEDEPLAEDETAEEVNTLDEDETAEEDESMAEDETVAEEESVAEAPRPVARNLSEDIAFAEFDTFGSDDDDDEEDEDEDEAESDEEFVTAEEQFSEGEPAVAEEPSSTDDDELTPASTENFYTPDDVLRQQRYEEQVKKTSLTSEVFDDMEDDIRKEVKKEFLHKRYGAPEDHVSEYDDDYSNEYAENSYEDSDENGYQGEYSEDGENEITVPVVHQASGNATISGATTGNHTGTPGVLNERNPLPPTSSRAQPKKPYFVPTELLEQYADDQYWIIDEQTKIDAGKLKETLNEFGISAEIIGIKKGPVVTMFELAPAPGVKLNRIVSLQDNIALSLAANSVRIVAPIPGRAAVGIEVPNRKRSIVSFREMIEQDLPEFKKMAVPVILGKDILGKSQIIDIAKTPHLLIAGATGAGKSVCVNSIILSILYKRSPKQVKMILVDPKVVELKLYNDIPHLLTPVITEPKKALQALQYCLCEMERRYALLDQMGVRDISSYNSRIEERNICTEKLPYIVIIIDEFADLMATSGKELESNVARLAAMSRAVGIHLVLATQRPSVNVITGLIKANIPSRIAFMVASRTDSNIIIDSVGAEKLLGKGDMLYASAVDPYPVRIQGTFESDDDVEKVVEYVKTLGEPEYIDDEIFVEDEEEEETGPSLFNEGSDPLYEQALDIVIQSGKASASYIQRRLKIGYNRAARLVEEMEERGIVGPANGSKAREIIHIPS